MHTCIIGVCLEMVLNSRVEQYFNTVIVFDYQLQIPLHFGNIVKTDSCNNHCNLKQIRYNYVVPLHNFSLFRPQNLTLR